MFPSGPTVNTLKELSATLAAVEQERLGAYFADAALGQESNSRIRAQTTVAFVTRLSKIRTRLFPNREIRLCILLDEFEALLKIQQVSVNTLMKMRLPDLTVKIAVRIAGVENARDVHQWRSHPVSAGLHAHVPRLPDRR